jgi:hypothetical protein
MRRCPDRCEDCGRFVGYYPVGFYDDRYCGVCYDKREDERVAREDRRRAYAR